MSNKFRIPWMVCLALVFLITTSAFTTTTPQDDKVVFGGSFVLADGDSLNGSLIILGGAVTLEQNSAVIGDVALMGGTLDVNGTINGSLIIIGGVTKLGANAIVNQDVVTIGGTLTRATGSQVLGDVNSFGSAPFNLDIPSTPIGPDVPVFTYYESPASFLWKVLSFFGSVVLCAALAMLIALLWAKPTQRVANAIRTNPIGTSGFGCLTLIVAPGLLVLVAITIILSPLSVLGMLLLIAAVVFGWVAINLEVGNRLARLFKVEWSAPVAAGIGALLFNLVIFSLGMIPCIGWALFTLVLLFALGGVLVTRFGSQEYPVAAAVPVRPVPPAAPAALVAPVLAAPKVTQPAAAKTPKAPAAKPSVKSTVAPKAKSTPPVVKPTTKATPSKPAGKSKTK